MKLTYRGVQYDYTPPSVEMQDTSEAGTYRGIDIRFRTVRKQPIQQATLDFVYRGAAYRTGEAVSEAVPAQVPATAAVAKAPAALADVELQARTMLTNHHRNVKRRQQAMLTRLATQVGLDAGNARCWNHIQGKVHPSFWATYDRSHAATS